MAGKRNGASGERQGPPAWRRGLALALGRQRLWRFGTVRLLWRLCPPGRYRRAFETELFGCRFRGDLWNLIDWWVYFTGAYEHGNAALLSAILEAAADDGRKTTVLDVGANVGVFTALFARSANRVVACEPFPLYAERLEALVADNRLENVMLVRKGLGSCRGDAGYRQDTGPNQTGSFAVEAVGSAGPALPLPLVRGDDLLAELDVERIDLIKIDTDGCEAEVLEGLRATLRRDRPIVLLEYGEQTARKLPTLAALQALLYDGAVVFRASQSRLAWRPRLREAREPLAGPDLLAVPAEAVAALPFRR